MHFDWYHFVFLENMTWFMTEQIWKKCIFSQFLQSHGHFSSSMSSWQLHIYLFVYVFHSVRWLTFQIMYCMSIFLLNEKNYNNLSLKILISKIAVFCVAPKMHIMFHISKTTRSNFIKLRKQMPHIIHIIKTTSNLIWFLGSIIPCLP